MTCEHLTTFNIGSWVRCSGCGLDPVRLDADGTPMLWPEGDHPDDWDAPRLVAWFLGNGLHLAAQGCDGFTFCRDNGAGTYGYVWVEVTVDRDYEMVWLLDVRRHDGDDERRRFLCVRSGPYGAFDAAWHDVEVPFVADTIGRLTAGLAFLAGQVQRPFPEPAH